MVIAKQTTKKQQQQATTINDNKQHAPFLGHSRGDIVRTETTESTTEMAV